MKAVQPLKSMSFYNFRDSTPDLAVFVNCSVIFSWAGFFTTSQKMLDFIQKTSIEKDPISMISYSMIRRLDNYYIGNWQIGDEKDEVYEICVRHVEFWSATIYIFYTGMTYLELGMYSGFIKMTEKLEELADTFDNSHARAQKFRFTTIGYLKFREFDKLIGFVDEGIAYIKTTGHEAILMVVYSLKAQLYVYLGKLKEASNAISQAEKLSDNHKEVAVYTLNTF